MWAALYVRLQSSLRILFRAVWGILAALLTVTRDLCFEDVGSARLLAQAEQSCDRMGIWAVTHEGRLVMTMWVSRNNNTVWQAAPAHPPSTPSHHWQRDPGG